MAGSRKNKKRLSSQVKKQVAKVAREEKKIEKTLKKVPRKITRPPRRRPVSKNEISKVAEPGMMKLSSNLANEYKAIQSAITMPIEVAPIRFSSPYTGARTAIAAPWTRIDCDWNPSTLGSTRFPVNEMVAFSFRDPLRSNIYLIGNPSANNYLYTCFWFNEESGINDNTLDLSCFDSKEVLFGSPTFALTGLDFQPHGPAVFPGTTTKMPAGFYWFNAGDFFQIHLQSYTFTGSTQGLTIIVYKWANGEVNEYTRFSTFSNSSTDDILSAIDEGGIGGYYGLGFVWEEYHTGDVCSLKVYFGGSSTCVFAHRSIPNLYSNLASCPEMRINAVSMMYTNDSAPLVKQGKVVGLQLPYERQWYDICGSSKGAFNFISNLQDSCMMPVNNGFYSYLRPRKVEDFDMRNTAEIVLSNVVHCSWDMDAKSDYLGMSIAITPDDGKDSYFTFCFGIEYVTTDVWRQTGVPKIDPQVFDKAMHSLYRVPQYYENKTHIGEIFERIKKYAQIAGKAIVEYGPGAIKLVGSML